MILAGNMICKILHLQAWELRPISSVTLETWVLVGVTVVWFREDYRLYPRRLVVV